MLPAALLAGPGVAEAFIFQFFPSCFRMSDEPRQRGLGVGCFQFFPSCFASAAGLKTSLTGSLFQFFPSCFIVIGAERWG